MRVVDYTIWILEHITNMTTKYIPIWEYCKKHNIPKQNVYRWIREGKLPKESFKMVEKTVRRIVIDSSYSKTTKATY